MWPSYMWSLYCLVYYTWSMHLWFVNCLCAWTCGFMEYAIVCIYVILSSLWSIWSGIYGCCIYFLWNAGNETKIIKKQRVQGLCRVLVHGKGPNGHFAVRWHTAKTPRGAHLCNLATPELMDARLRRAPFCKHTAKIWQWDPPAHTANN
jgi:hypothetical protein